MALAGKPISIADYPGWNVTDHLGVKHVGARLHVRPQRGDDGRTYGRAMILLTDQASRRYNLMGWINHAHIMRVPGQAHTYQISGVTEEGAEVSWTMEPGPSTKICRSCSGSRSTAALAA